jgi:hypothetical protein
VKKKDIRLGTDDTYDANWQDDSETDNLLESTVGQLLSSEAGHEEEDSFAIGSRASRNGLNGAGRRSKQEEIEALLERMVFSEKAFLEYPN